MSYYIIHPDICLSGSPLTLILVRIIGVLTSQTNIIRTGRVILLLVLLLLLYICARIYITASAYYIILLSTIRPDRVR